MKQESREKQTERNVLCGVTCRNTELSEEKVGKIFEIPTAVN
jgi:hypothetical protein